VSFLYAVESAVLAEVQAKCGVGSTTYPTPTYLLLQTCERGEISPRLEIHESKLPGLRIQYFQGTKREGGIGFQRNQEEWNIATVLVLTPEVLGCEPDPSTFMGAVSEAAETVMARLRWVLSHLRPGVVDETFRQRTAKSWVNSWGYFPFYRSDSEIQVTILLSYFVDVEQDF